jgi:hypothetical protein
MYTIHTHTHHDQKVNILNFIRFTLGSLKLILQEKFTSPTDIQLINDYYIILYNLNQEIVFCAVYACRAEDRNKHRTEKTESQHLRQLLPLVFLSCLSTKTNFRTV